MKINLTWPGIFLMAAALILQSCSKPKERIVLKQVKDVVADATSDPKLKATAVFFNPNPQSGKLKSIKVDIYVNEKKVGVVDQTMKIKIPANGEFTVPLEVGLNMKELGFMDTVFGMLGGKKFDIRYEGHLKVTYHGVPIKVPVKYKDQVRVSF